MEYVLTFKNTSFAIRSEQALIAGGVSVAVMPLPSQIRAGCGICLRVAPGEIAEALRILGGADTLPSDIYTRTEDGGAYEYGEVADRSTLWSGS